MIDVSQGDNVVPRYMCSIFDSKKVQRLLSIVDERNELVQLIEEQKDTDQMNSSAEMSADMSASSIPDISSSDISSSEISDFN